MRAPDAKAIAMKANLLKVLYYIQASAENALTELSCKDENNFSTNGTLVLTRNPIINFCDAHTIEELINLGYKVSLVTSPDGLRDLTVDWSS